MSKFVCFLLGNSPASEFYMSTFRNTHKILARKFSSQNFSRINTPIFSNLVILHTYSPVKMEQTEYSEMSANKIQTPGNYPVESIQHSEQEESLISRV